MRPQSVPAWIGMAAWCGPLPVVSPPLTRKMRLKMSSYISGKMLDDSGKTVEQRWHLFQRWPVAD